jgi:hypothetical protein
MNTPTQPNDGGPAFPLPVEEDIDCHNRYRSGYGGMTLRDWFAGQALAGLVALSRPDSSVTSDTLLAYHLADAMLAARKNINPTAQ